MKFLRPFCLVRVLWGPLWTNAFGLLSGWNCGHRLLWSSITACCSGFLGQHIGGVYFPWYHQSHDQFSRAQANIHTYFHYLRPHQSMSPSLPSRLHLSKEGRPLAMVVSIMHLDFDSCLVASIQAPNSSRYRLALKLISTPCMASGMWGGAPQVSRTRHINSPSFNIDRDWQRTNSNLIQLPRTNWQLCDLLTLEGQSRTDDLLDCL